MPDYGLGHAESIKIKINVIRSLFNSHIFKMAPMK